MSTDTATKETKQASGQRPEHAWHAMQADEIESSLDTTTQGLQTDQVAERQATYGENTFATEKCISWFKRLLAQVNNMLIYVLILAAIVTVMVGHAVDAAVILAVVVLNVGIGLYQEGKAEQSLQAIRKLLTPKAKVRRDGRSQTIPAEGLVPGDVIQVGSGDHLPADVRWFDTNNLQVDESPLTGESVPVQKDTETVKADVVIGDRLSMGYAGTLVTKGQGRAFVVETGMRTEMGRIGRLIESVELRKTPLIEKIDQFARWLTLTILLASGLLFAFGFWVRDIDGAEMLMAVVGLAVAAIPEGLPAILTITLAIGVQRMAKRQAVIRRLPAVETLGAVTVICSDKTGTLTRNEMTVQSVCLSDDLLTVQGVGYGPEGEVTDSDDKPLEALEPPKKASEIASASQWLALIGLLCNEAALHQSSSGDWGASGDPTEASLLTLGAKLGLDQGACQSQFPRIAVIPFESAHRFMATSHGQGAGGETGGTGEGFILVKGAPEVILDLANDQMTSAGERVALDKDMWLRAVESQAEVGRRVLAFAIKTNVSGLSKSSLNDEIGNLTIVGLTGIIDPPREEAIASIELCKQAGIRVKMITGDHAGTARAIAVELGLTTSDETPLTGREIEALTDEELKTAVKEKAVFARSSPEHKIRLVKALQANAEVVAMTGDGVNDAPALKQADIGIAMGKKGTEAAKQAAEIVLADDNFASIVNAVKEGRTVYDNLKKSIAFLLPTNGGESVAIIVAIAIGATLPITPLQILWVNMVTAIGLGIVLAFEPPEADIMSRAPRARETPLLSPFLIWRIVFVSLLFLVGIFGVFHWTLMNGGSIDLARTMAVNALVSMEIFYLFSVRFLKNPSFNWRGIKGTPRILMAVAFVVVLQLAFTYLPFSQQIFDTQALSAAQLFITAGVGASTLIVLELEKLIVRSRHIEM